LDSTPADIARLTAAAPRVDGQCLLRVARSDGVTRLGELYMRDPLRVLFPRPAAGEPFQAVLATTSGGLVGGDRLAIDVSVGDGAALQLVGQAAEKIYRSLGPETEVAVTLRAAPGALMEFLPQGTILFDASRLRRRVNVAAAGDAQVLTGEIVTFGRIASGERVTRGLLHDRWSIRRDGKLVWADALSLMGDIAGTLAVPAGFDGAKALGTVVYLAPNAGQSLELARGLLDTGVGLVRAGASLVNGVLVARFLSADPAALRHAFGMFWREFRAGACALPARLPTIWNV
jgi:urease accessory protein